MVLLLLDGLMILNYLLHFFLFLLSSSSFLYSSSSIIIHTFLIFFFFIFIIICIFYIIICILSRYCFILYAELAPFCWFSCILGLNSVNNLFLHPHTNNPWSLLFTTKNLKNHLIIQSQIYKISNSSNKNTEIKNKWAKNTNILSITNFLGKNAKY